MAHPLPPARAVAPRPWSDYAQAALLVVVSLGVPIAIRLWTPPETAWIRWALFVVPGVVWAAAIAQARLTAGSAWLVVRDPARRRDARRWIYGLLDAAFAVGYLIAFDRLMPNRHGWAMAVLELLPLAMWTMAIATLAARRWSWWLVVGGGAVMLAWTIGIFFLLLYTASYLAGVYGAFGKAASSGVLGAAVLLIQFTALVPALQLKWAMTRSGRRAFALAPLWPGARASAGSRA